MTRHLSTFRFLLLTLLTTTYSALIPAATPAPSPAPTPLTSERLGGWLVAPDAPPDFRSLVKAQSATVVNIRILKARKSAPETTDSKSRRAPENAQEASLGSGFVVSPNGIILTNRHVVADAERIRIRFSDRRELPARILGVDPLTDVAVLKVEAEKLPTAILGDSSRLEVGQWVLAIGAPLGLERTATHGIISALGRSLPNDSYVSFIQTDVPINPGNSGGPLFDQAGKVVGINSQIVSNSGGYMGLSFAIPINDAMRVARQIIEQGRAIHGWLGVGSQELTLELALAHGLDIPKGSLVTDLAPGGPAEMAGLQPGDIILRLNDLPIAESSDLPPLISASQPGQEVLLTVLREQQTVKLRIKVGEWGRDNAPEKFRKSVLVRNETLGIGLSTLTDAARQVMNLKTGVLVEEVTEGLAMDAGIRPGDILLRLGTVSLSNPGKLADVLSKANRERPLALLIRRQDANTFLTLVLPKTPARK